MTIKPIDHYSITNITPTVYDEQALTVLELVGRVGQKINEAIAAYNELEETTGDKLAAYDAFIKVMNDVTMPQKVKYEVESHIRNGDFDKAINVYLGDLEGRLNNLLGSITQGSTSMDAEVIDIRFAADGRQFSNAGSAIRAQFMELTDSAYDKASIKARDYGYDYNYNNGSFWEQGWLSTTTGATGDTGTDYEHYVRTRAFISPFVERVIVIDLRAQLFTYNKTTGSFIKVEPLRGADYRLDHDRFKYKIHVTGADSNVLNYHTTKAEVNPEDAGVKVLFLARPIIKPNDDVNASAVKLGYQNNINYRSLWSQGYLYGANGEPGNDPRGYDYWLYSRTDNYIPESVDAVAVKAGCKGRLFRYEKDRQDGDNFVDFVNVKVEPVQLDHDKYNYRFDVTLTTNDVNVKNPVNDMWSNVLLLSDPAPEVSGEVKSPFDKGIDIPPISNPTYPELMTEDIIDPWDDPTYDEIVNFMLELEDSSPFTKTFKLCDITVGNRPLSILGVRLNHPTIDGSISSDKPTIVIVGGQHGFEKANVIGMLELINEIGNCWDNYSGGWERAIYQSAMFYLANFNFIFIPVLNPYGFDLSEYKNENGVNLNRNYDYKWTKVADSSSDYYGGEAPFDQPATRALRDLIRSENNVVLVIDSHAKGSGAVPSNRDLNWIIAPGETDKYYTRLANVCRNHLTAFGHFMRHYVGLDLDAYGETVGYYEGFDGTVNTIPSLDNWCVYNEKIMSLTFEGFNDMPGGDGTVTVTNILYNAQMLLNFILRFCEEYSRR